MALRAKGGDELKMLLFWLVYDIIQANDFC